MYLSRGDCSNFTVDEVISVYHDFVGCRRSRIGSFRGCENPLDLGSINEEIAGDRYFRGINMVVISYGLLI